MDNEQEPRFGVTHIFGWEPYCDECRGGWSADLKATRKEAVAALRWLA